jgi:hypothetical protein
VMLEPAVAYSEDEMRQEMRMPGTAIAQPETNERPNAGVGSGTPTGAVAGPAGEPAGVGAAAVQANRQQRIGS